MLTFSSAVEFSSPKKMTECGWRQLICIDSNIVTSNFKFSASNFSLWKTNTLKTSSLASFVYRFVWLTAALWHYLID